VWQKASTEMYAAGANAQPNGANAASGNAANSSSDVTDVDYEEVKNN
jgi:hypothetical protein